MFVTGFKEGDSCWVSTDIVAGKTNYESGANFYFNPRATLHCKYEVKGGALNPSFSDVIHKDVAPDPSCRSVCVRNRGNFVAAFRVKTNGKDSGISGKVVAGDDACWDRNNLNILGEQLGAVVPQRMPANALHKNAACEAHASSSARAILSQQRCARTHSSLLSSQKFTCYFGRRGSARCHSVSDFGAFYDAY